MKLVDKLIEIGYQSKEAQALIMSGNVLVNEEIVLIGSFKVKDNDLIRIKEKKLWVSRGAYKLLEAFKKFNINVKDKICLDVGASTGGFTEVLLKNEAKKIYALDSGQNQLDYKLRQNEKVISLEKTNLKKISTNLFKEKIDFLCCDVSFISVKHLFLTLSKNNVLNKENDLIILIKPQFEADVELVEKGGFVNKKYHKKIIEEITYFAKSLDFNCINYIESPIKGNKSKNTEYLAWFKRGNYE